MIIKKFTGKTEEEAVKAAQIELGAQAVIMNVKKAKKKGLAGKKLSIKKRLTFQILE